MRAAIYNPATGHILQITRKSAEQLATDPRAWVEVPGELLDFNADGVGIDVTHHVIDGALVERPTH